MLRETYYQNALKLIGQEKEVFLIDLKHPEMSVNLVEWIYDLCHREGIHILYSDADEDAQPTHEEAEIKPVITEAEEIIAEPQKSLESPQDASEDEPKKSTRGRGKKTLMRESCLRSGRQERQRPSSLMNSAAPSK